MCNYNAYFTYKGMNYGAKTGVRFAQSYLDTHTFDGKKIWKYGWFSNRLIQNGKTYYVFYLYKIYGASLNEWGNCAGHCFVAQEDLETAIEEIERPILVVVAPRKKRKDFDVPEVLVGWCIYAAVLFFSLIFYQWYLLWFWATVYFFTWRNKKLWERDR